MFLSKETQYIEYPILFKKDKSGKTRVWKIILRLIKKHSQKKFQNIDWNMMDEIQVPILQKYLDVKLPDDLQAEFWTETGVVGGKITRAIPTYPEEKFVGKKNYRDTLKQGIFMCQSKWEKKKDKVSRRSRIKKIKERNQFKSQLIKKYFPCLQKI